jgi:hypothetical protein
MTQLSANAKMSSFYILVDIRKKSEDIDLMLPGYNSGVNNIRKTLRIPTKCTDVTFPC